MNAVPFVLAGSGGLPIRGDLHLPPGDGPHPVAVGLTVGGANRVELGQLPQPAGGCAQPERHLDLPALDGPEAAAEWALERARERAASEGDLSIDLQNRDAAAYQFERQAYDRVFSRFGVMFFADPAAAFANIRAALKPGGRLAFVCWQPLDLNPWMATTIAVASQDLERPDPPGPDDPGPFAFRDPERVKAILSDAGFSNIEISSNRLALNFEPDIESTVRKLLQLGPMAQPFAEAPEETRARIRENLAAAIQDYLTEDGVKIDSASWIVSADNP